MKVGATEVAVSRGPSSQATPPNWLKRIRYFLSSPTFLLPTGAFMLFIAAWEVFARRTSPVLFPSPLAVVTAYGELVESGQLWQAFLTTMQTLALGFLLAVIVGVTLGVIMGRAPIIADVLEPYIDAVYATPRVVLVPLVILWFGIGDTGRLVIVFIGTVIPIILNTAIGVRNARPDLVDVGRSFGASERDLVRHVILPGSIPYLMAGMRIAVGRALVGVVVAEIFLDLTGLGGLIQTNSAYFRVDRMIAVVLVLAVIGTLLMLSIGKLESRFSSWR